MVLEQYQIALGVCRVKEKAMPKMLCASGISIEKTVKEAFFFLNTRNLSDVQ